TQNKQPTATGFGQNEIFNGQNRQGGAMITYSKTNPQTKKTTIKTDKKKKGSETTASKGEKPPITFDSIIFEVFNDKNELIRTIKQKAPKENGVHRMYWYMNEKGKQRPSRRKPRENASEPGGVSVMPGNYKIKLHYGNETATEKIAIAYDPRVEMPFEVLKNKYDLLKQLENKMDVAAKATQHLLASKEILEDYQKRIKAQKKQKKYEDILKSHTEIMKKIDGLLDDMFGKEDKRQGITATEFPSTISYLYKARRYVSSLLQNPGQTEINLVKNADEKVSAVIFKINEFYKTDWLNYKNSVENLKLSPFEEIKELEYK
ncbi:MAG: hypothetical protein AB1Z17_00485, partial [Lutibacter sp.]